MSPEEIVVMALSEAGYPPDRWLADPPEAEWDWPGPPFEVYAKACALAGIEAMDRGGYETPGDLGVVTDPDASAIEVLARDRARGYIGYSTTGGSRLLR